MLSILIPIYNFDVRDFVRDLSEQASHISSEVEIICLDDGSDAVFKSMHTDLKALPHVRYMEAERNLGRSGVRNRLLEEAKFELLLFLDCDGRVVRSDYLQCYLGHGDADVIYGGRTYAAEPPIEPDRYFHWYCGKHKEEVSVKDRNKAPYKAFMTNNFLVQRKVYEQVRMDEALNGYGHEDTLFAAELKRAGFQVRHIDNPIEHIGVEEADVFLDKSHNAIRNLAQLIQRDKVGAGIPLVRYYLLLRRLRMDGLFGLLVTTLERSILKQLKGKRPSLQLFDLWKLGLLCKTLQQ